MLTMATYGVGRPKRSGGGPLPISLAFADEAKANRTLQAIYMRGITRPRVSKMSKHCRAGAFLFLTVVTLANSAAAATTIRGGGSTFIDPILTKWVDTYSTSNPSVRVDYNAVGSLQGLDALLARSTDFAASDAPLHLKQVQEPACRTLYFPTTLGAVVVIYNLPSLPTTSRIKLDGQVLGDIFLGKIRNWNDPAIAALNPELSLPASPVILWYRSDGSGTTYTFTDYLSKTDPQWASKVGTGLQALWPVGLAAKGNEGVVEGVKGQPGSIGYVELSYALAQNVPYAVLRNRAGAWTEANAQSMSAAAESLATAMPTDLEESITDAPDPAAYPISSYSYLVFFQQQHDAEKADAFNKFVTWIIHDGQTYAAPLHYAPLPSAAVSRAEAQLKAIAVINETHVSACESLGIATTNAEPPPVHWDSDTAGPLFSD
jgi:phosphate transport system substrate-binding protein